MHEMESYKEGQTRPQEDVVVLSFVLFPFAASNLEANFSRLRVYYQFQPFFS